MGDLIEPPYVRRPLLLWLVISFHPQALLANPRKHNAIRYDIPPPKKPFSEMAIRNTLRGLALALEL